MPAALVARPASAEAAAIEVLENLDKIAWYCHNAGPRTHPVGQKDANGWGLYDVSGNAFEWVNDPAIYTSPQHRRSC